MTLPGDEEEWRPVDWAPGYEVSSHGRVRSWKTRGAPLPHLLTPGPVGGRIPYLAVGLYGSTGRRRTRHVHRLVADAFLGPLPPGMETRHKDGDSTNNRRNNLSYGTKTDNAEDRRAHGNYALRDRCIHGHPFDEENTYVYPKNGQRMCRACHRTQSNEGYHRRRRTRTSAGHTLGTRR